MSNITLYTSSVKEIQKWLTSHNYTVSDAQGNCLTITRGTKRIIYSDLSYILAKSAEQLLIIYETTSLLKEISSSVKSTDAIKNNILFKSNEESTAKRALEIERILKRGGEINLDGYILFYMKTERAAFRKASQAAIKDILIRREYEQFIKDLSDYVESSAQQEAELHIIPHKGRYKLINSQKADLTASLLSAYQAELPPGEINYDDWLVDALLDLLPAKIIIHHNSKIANKNVLTTIASIFKGKVSFC